MDPEIFAVFCFKLIHLVKINTDFALFFHPLFLNILYLINKIHVIHAYKVRKFIIKDINILKIMLFKIRIEHNFLKEKKKKENS